MKEEEEYLFSESNPKYERIGTRLKSMELATLLNMHLGSKVRGLDPLNPCLFFNASRCSKGQEVSVKVIVNNFKPRTPA